MSKIYCLNIDLFYRFSQIVLGLNELFLMSLRHLVTYLDLSIHAVSFSLRIRGCQIIQLGKEGKGHQINLASLYILLVPGNARVTW